VTVASSGGNSSLGVFHNYPFESSVLRVAFLALWYLVDARRTVPLHLCGHSAVSSPTTLAGGRPPRSVTLTTPSPRTRHSRGELSESGRMPRTAPGSAAGQRAPLLLSQVADYAG